MAKAKKQRKQHSEGPKELMSTFIQTKKNAEVRFSEHPFSVKAEIVEDVETAINCRRSGTITQAELADRICKATEAIVRTQCAWFKKNIVRLLQLLISQTLYDLRKEANLWRFKDDPLTPCRAKRVAKSLDAIEEYLRQNSWIDLDQAKDFYDTAIKAIIFVCDEQYRIERQRHEKLDQKAEAERKRKEEEQQKLALKQAEEEADVLSEMLKSA